MYRYTVKIMKFLRCFNTLLYATEIMTCNTLNWKIFSSRIYQDIFSLEVYKWKSRKLKSSQAPTSKNWISRYSWASKRNCKKSLIENNRGAMEIFVFPGIYWNSNELCVDCFGIFHLQYGIFTFWNIRVYAMRKV